MVFLGANVYYWGDIAQRRFLTQSLRPIAKDVFRKGLADSFWYFSFDIRGPHLFILFRTRHEFMMPLKMELSCRFEEYLKCHPSQVMLGQQELIERDRQCHGRALCVADRKPGLGYNNSIRFFVHTTANYPFFLCKNFRIRDSLERSLFQSASWAIERLSSGQRAYDAIQFVKLIDCSLDDTTVSPVELWRNHACTLLPGMADRFTDGIEEQIVNRLPNSIGERNRMTFERIWQQPIGLSNLPPEIGTLLSEALHEPGHERGTYHRLIREWIHITLNQLLLPVEQEIPLVLFAWHRRATTKDAYIASDPKPSM